MPRQTRYNLVQNDELRRALRLAFELRELPHGSEAQRLHALDGLCALVGAQVGLWVAVAGMDSGRVVIQRALDRGWAGERERGIFLHFRDTEQQQMQDPSMAGLGQKFLAPCFTLIREQLLDDRTWYRSEHVQELRRAARVDSFIYTVARTSGGEARCISLHRPWGAKPFSERERQLIDVFHGECRWLHEPPRTVDDALLHGLRPRLRDTLHSLARGLGEKQVAAELGLSPHTVHEYAKALYRHFAVSSRGELLALCLAAAAKRG